MLSCFHYLCCICAVSIFFPRGSVDFVIKHIYHKVTNQNVSLWALVLPQLKFIPGQYRLTFSTQDARSAWVKNFNMKTFVFSSPGWFQAEKASVKMPGMMTSRARGARKAGNWLASSHFHCWT